MSSLVKFVFYAYIVYWTMANTTNSYMLRLWAQLIIIMQNIKEQALATYTWTNNIVQKTDSYMYMYQKIPGPVIIQPVLAQGWLTRTWTKLSQ